MGVKVKAMKSKARHSVIMPEVISQKMNIGFYKTRYTLRVTTQKGVRHAVHRIHRRYRIDNMELNRNCLNEQFYTDQLLNKTKSLEGNMGAWLYTSKNFTVEYSCTKHSEVGDTL